MKRSNLIFLILITTLFVVPFLVVGVFALLPGEKLLYVDDISLVKIENPALQPGDVIIGLPDTGRTTHKWPFHLKDTRSYLYYQGKTTYLPEVRYDEGILYVGLPQEAASETNLTLHLNIDGLQKVWLNGEEIQQE